jgi:hypothetical protein
MECCVACKLHIQGDHHTLVVSVSCNAKTRACILSTFDFLSRQYSQARETRLCLVRAGSPRFECSDDESMSDECSLSWLIHDQCQFWQSSISLILMLAMLDTKLPAATPSNNVAVLHLGDLQWTDGDILVSLS